MQNAINFVSRSAPNVQLQAAQCVQVFELLLGLLLQDRFQPYHNLLVYGYNGTYYGWLDSSTGQGYLKEIDHESLVELAERHYIAATEAQRKEFAHKLMGELAHEQDYTWEQLLGYFEEHPPSSVNKKLEAFTALGMHKWTWNKDEGVYM